MGGLFARAAVPLGRVEGALVVPPAALQRDGATPGEAQTFVVPDGKAERKTVTLGVEGADAIQVTEGLQPRATWWCSTRRWPSPRARPWTCRRGQR